MGGSPLTIGAQNAGNKCAVTIANSVITCASLTDSGWLSLTLGSGHDVLEFDATLGIFAALFEPALIFGAGNDTLRLDTLYNGQSVFAIGGDGLDTVDFSGRATPANATLRPGTSTLQGETMRPDGFEQMIGSTGNDVLAAEDPGGVLLGDRGTTSRVPTSPSAARARTP